MVRFETVTRFVKAPRQVFSERKAKRQAQELVRAEGTLQVLGLQADQIKQFTLQLAVRLLTERARRDRAYAQSYKAEEQRLSRLQRLSDRAVGRQEEAAKRERNAHRLSATARHLRQQLEGIPFTDKPIVLANRIAPQYVQALDFWNGRRKEKIAYVQRLIQTVRQEVHQKGSSPQRIAPKRQPLVFRQPARNLSLH